MKVRLSALLACALVVALAACTKRPAKPLFEISSVDSMLHGSGFNCRVSYRFASIKNAPGHPALEQIERDNIGYFFDLEAFEGTAAEAADSAIALVVDEFAMPEGVASDETVDLPAWEGEISIESEGTVVDTLLSYAITRSSYTGGAHGMYTTVYHTYSLTDGFELSLADLFTVDELQLLDGAIRERIARDYGAVNDEELAAQGFFPEYISPTENFRITDEGIEFLYNPYEIGCYALGNVEVHFTREELDAIFAGEVSFDEALGGF